MKSVARILAIWLTPAVVLAVPAALAARGPEGLWLGLLVTLAPLIALGWGAGRPAPGADPKPAETLFPVATLLVTVGVLLWANIALAGDAAAWLGARRWQGIVITATAGWLLTAWRPLRRTAPLLLAIAFVAAVVVLLQLAWALALGPIAAWDRLASQPAFRFPPSSTWVIGGRDLGVVRGGAPLVFDEVHRLTAPTGGVLRARTLDGSRLAEMEWTLAPGQTVTLRAGDEITRASTLRLRFEADKRVPGSPASGIVWADGRPRGWPERVGLAVTLLAGAAALLRAGVPLRLSRDGVGFAAGALLLVFVWAQGWAIYAMLQAPDLFLGGLTLERMLELPAHALFAEPWRRTLQALLLAAGLAAFLASSLALRERLGALDPTGGGEIGHDPGLWAGLFGGAALASLWPADPWALSLLALGGAGCALGPAALWPPRHGRTATTAGVVGLVVFAGLAAAQLRGSNGALLTAATAYPALVAAPVGAFVLWLGRRVRP
ncbi:MAG TPA: hypothetical protein VIE41_20735 [Methylomirabilota bacterium]|jgi:hypothetical protein